MDLAWQSITDSLKDNKSYDTDQQKQLGNPLQFCLYMRLNARSISRTE